MTEPSGAPSVPPPTGERAHAAVLHWPERSPPTAEEAVETVCGYCAQRWRVHRDLGGYRLRCVCPGWIQVPFPGFLLDASATKTRALEPPRSLPARGAASPPVASATSTLEPSRTPEISRAGRAPDATHAPPDDGPTPRQIDRGLLDLIAIGIAFLVPPTAIHLWGGTEALLQWLPALSLVSGILVVIVGWASGPVGFEGLRGTRPRYYLGALLAALVGVACAAGWQWALRDSGFLDGRNFIAELRGSVGLTGTLLAVVLGPAIFEELAFRGLLQGRLVGILGLGSGIVVTTLVFAFAHGVSAATPIHILLGLVLSLLRHRSGSLYPGMLLHGAYNGGVVALALS